MNKVSLVGRLTQDVFIKTTNNNIQIANFSLAIKRKFSKNGETDFINIVAWDKVAALCEKFLKKGQQVGISGRIQTRSWDDAEGKKRYATEVVAEEITLIGDAPKSNSNDYDDVPF